MIILRTTPSRNPTAFFPYIDIDKTKKFFSNDSSPLRTLLEKKCWVEGIESPRFKSRTFRWTRKELTKPPQAHIIGFSACSLLSKDLQNKHLCMLTKFYIFGL